MNNSELLRNSRDLLLKLHKALVDFEKESYVAFNGPVTPTEFLNQLLENPDLSWLRKFSTLIVDIDEMFAQRDGFEDEAVQVHLVAVRKLLWMDGHGDYFKARYEMALQGVPRAAALHGNIKQLLDV